MAIAATGVGTQLPSVKCRICGRPSLRGAKLCDQCVAAVKRARHVNTIASQFMPQPLPGAPVHPPLRAPRASPPRRSERWSWLPTKPAEWGVLIAFTVFAGAVVGTAYLAVQEIADRGHKETMTPAAIDASAAHANAAPGATAAPAHTTGAAEYAPAEGAATSPESIEAAHAEDSSAVVESAQATPLPEKLAPRRTATESRKKLTVRTNPPHSSEVNDEGKAMIAAPGPARAVLPSPPTPAPEAVVPDRWEAMNAALAACSRESLLAGVMCTERVRYQYCEGFWGQVPQCRAATRPGSSR